VTTPLERPGPREAGPELLVLSKWEEFADWLLDVTARWPKNTRFTLTQRIENHALDILERLVECRYEPGTRKEGLRAVNLTLERMRYLFRRSKRRGVLASRGFERALAGVDEVGRMIGGWRKELWKRP